jgi:hypothetical protein
MSNAKLAVAMLVLALAGCTSTPPSGTGTVAAPTGVPQTTITASPPSAPASGQTPSAAAEAKCSSITSQQGGGTAYLNCLNKH